MTTFLGAYLVAHVIELVCWQKSIWRFRKYTIPAVMVLTAASSIALLIFSTSFVTSLLVVVAVYRLINLARITSGQMQPEYLKRTSWRTTLWLLSVTVLLCGLWYGFHFIEVSAGGFWVLIIELQLALAVALLVTTVKHAKSMKPDAITQWLPDAKLPTLTVAIPARNETDDLQKLLESLVASTYPKLEIIVLDDCSTTRRTPEIIRSFAHAGVRFIQGEPPKEGWLAKNQAYQRLLEEANGEIILFCGADVQFEPQTLKNLVTMMLEKNKSMMSVMPRNILPRFLQLDASLIQPMRYAWEIALPRKLFRRPPVLSTCWIAKRDILLASGGFSAVSRSIVPESYFARQTVSHDGYGFRYSNALIGLTSHKAVSDQRDTATRTKYPQVHRRPELVMLLTLGELFGLVMPFMFLIVGLMYPALTLVLVLSALACLLLVAWYLTVCAMTYRQPDLRSLVSLPFAALLDVALLNYSMLKYEFSVVLWKDRNVCIPVMRVEPQLPPLDNN
jgi:glycosyltransferase involved in cell wall biosynthesis